ALNSVHQRRLCPGLGADPLPPSFVRLGRHVILLANIFQPLVDVFEWILLRFHDVLHSWGWAVIAMTIVVRDCLLPLTFKQFKSMQSLATHAPEMKKLQERYKN